MNMNSRGRDSNLLAVPGQLPPNVRKTLTASGIPTSPLTLALQILQDHPTRRKESDLQQLAAFLSNIRFFQELSERTDSDTVKTTCKYLTHEAWRKGEVVFRKGDQGSKFYIVMSGVVGIYVRTSVVQNNFRDEPFGKVLKSALELQEVKELSAGGSFGELALITNNLRAATVQCKSDCHFAVLEKTDYMRILGKFEHQKLEEVVEFLQSLPLFQGWGKLALQRISYYFNSVKYIRKQCVYRSRDSPSHVYIIKSGEFEFLKDIAKSMDTIKAPKLGSRELFRKYQVTILGKGEVFGDREILERIPRLYTCCCLSNGTLLVISKEVGHMQDFETRILVEEDHNKLRKMHEAKANIRESRVRRLISLNSGGSAPPVAPNASVSLAAKPKIHHSSTMSTLPDPSLPAYRKTTLRSWRQILKKFRKLERKKLKLNAVLPETSQVEEPRKSVVHLKLPNNRYSCMENRSFILASPTWSGSSHSRDLSDVSDTETQKVDVGQRKTSFFRRSLAY